VYEVDHCDSFVQLHNAPQSDIGAPLPHLIGDEQHLLLAQLYLELIALIDIENQ
jgi:hypothetical protein